MTACCSSTWRHRDGSMWSGSRSSDERDLIRGGAGSSQAGPSYPAKALAQAVPFQCKISELVVDTLVSWSPTAKASLPDTALTPNSDGLELRATAAKAWPVAGTAAAAPVAAIPPRPAASTPAATTRTTRLLARPIAPSCQVTRGTAPLSRRHPATGTGQ